MRTPRQVETIEGLCDELRSLGWSEEGLATLARRIVKLDGFDKVGSVYEASAAIQGLLGVRDHARRKAAEQIAAAAEG